MAKTRLTNVISRAFSNTVGNMTISKGPVALGPYCSGKVLSTNAGGVWGFSSGLTGRCPDTSELVSL